MSRRDHKARPRKPRFPIGTIAQYGPNATVTTKVVAAVLLDLNREPILRRWVGTNVATDAEIQDEIAAFFKKHHVVKVVATNENMGCPHEEGPDFPIGEDCPFCPYWAGKQGTARRL